MPRLKHRKPSNTVGVLMRQWRQVAGISRKEAGARVGLSHRTIESIENSKLRQGDILTELGLHGLIKAAGEAKIEAALELIKANRVEKRNENRRQKYLEKAAAIVRGARDELPGVPVPKERKQHRKSGPRASAPLDPMGGRKADTLAFLDDIINTKK